MKSKILTAGLIAAMMVPAMAQAQTGELRRDRQDIRQEQRDLNHAKRYGDRGDVRGLGRRVLRVQHPLHAGLHVGRAHRTPGAHAL